MTLDGVTMTSTEQDHSFSYIRAQVARILLEYAKNGSNGQNLLTQREIATTLGSNIYQVHLSILSLYNEGLIRIEHRRIIIKKELLQKVAATA
jgi:predicted transcriptional regulator